MHVHVHVIRGVLQGQQDGCKDKLGVGAIASLVRRYFYRRPVCSSSSGSAASPLASYLSCRGNKGGAKRSGT